MYAAGYVSKIVEADVVFYHFFNCLLWILLAMNIYWFKVSPEKVNVSFQLLVLFTWYCDCRCNNFSGYS